MLGGTFSEWPPGRNSLYALLKYMQPQGVWFLSSFDLEKVIKDFDHIVSQRNRLGFSLWLAIESVCLPGS